MIVTARVNRITLNRGADLFFDGENVFVPFGNVAAKDLRDRLGAVGADEIRVEYRTVSDAKEKAKDAKKFAKRLHALAPNWVATPWANKVVDGFVFDVVMTCTITRTENV